MQLKDAGEAMGEIASIHVNPDHLGTFRTAILKKEFMKDAVVKFKLLEHNIERLETRFRC